MKLAFRPHGLDLDASFSHGLAAAFGLLAGIGGLTLAALPAGPGFTAGWGPLLIALVTIPLSIVAALHVIPRRVPASALQVCFRYLALFSALLTTVGALTRFHLSGLLGVGLVGLALAAGLLYGVLDHLEGGGAEARAQRAEQEAAQAATMRHVAEMHVAGQERLARHRREIAAFDRRLRAAGVEPAGDESDDDAVVLDLADIEFVGDVDADPVDEDEARASRSVFVYDVPAAAAA